MRKRLLTLSLFCMGSIAVAKAQDLAFTDPAFKTAILTNHPEIDANNNGEITQQEADDYTGAINVPSEGITSLGGIEYFYNITALDCSDNQLSGSLNLYNNNWLTTVNISENQLTSFEYNADLHTLNCSGNSYLSALITPGFGLPNLVNLNCSNTQLQTLPVGKAPNLQVLSCSNTLLMYLHLHANANLTTLDCSDNPSLYLLNLKNGNNENITSINAANIGYSVCIQVDDENWALANWGQHDPMSNFDFGSVSPTAFTEDCPGACFIDVPDNTFKNALLGYGTTIDVDGDGFVSCDEAASYTGDINVAGLGISDFTGLEEFVAITELSVYQNNMISALDLSANTALTTLNVYQNGIMSALDLNANTALTSLNCFANPLLDSLDLSKNTALTGINVAGNSNLSFLNLANGNNTAYTIISAQANPNLSCIQVDNAAYSTANWTGTNFNFDASVNFSEDCEALLCVVDIPDNNFKSYLITLGIDTNGDNEIQCAEAAAYTGYMDIQNTVTDVTGLEAFTAMPTLYFGATVTSLDLSANTALNYLRILSPSLTSLNLTGNTALTDLGIYSTSFTSLDLSANTALDYLDLQNNAIAILDLSANTVLTYVGVDYHSSLTSLNLGNNTVLNELYAVNNPLLTSVNINGCTALTYIDVYSNSSFASLDISNNTNLQYLRVNDNALTSLDVSNNTDLNSLRADNNALNSLDVSNNTDLQYLIVNDNAFNAIDLSNNPNLVHLNIGNNDLASLDLSNNNNLEMLYANNNALTLLNLANGNNAAVTDINVENNPNLTCIEVDDEVWSAANWTGSSFIFDATASFSENCNYVYPPATPTNLTATLNSSPLSVSLVWTNNSPDEDGFRVERSINSGAFTQIIDLPANTTTYIDNSVTENNVYIYKVYAYNATGNSAHSNLQQVNTTVAPNAPTNLVATLNVSPLSVSLTWTDNTTNETGYKIERSTDGTTFAEIASVLEDVTTYTDNTVIDNTTYYYQVYAYNTVGNSANSNVDSVTISINPPVDVPATPTNLTATAIANPLSVALSWEDNANNEIGYKIERSLDGTTFTEIADVNADETSYTDNNVTEETTYYYRVYAYTNDTISAFSNIAQATTGSAPAVPIPATPTNLMATASTTPISVSLTWADNANNEIGYKIERSLDGTTFTEIADVNADVTTYWDTLIAENTTYHYRVYAYSADTISAFSNVAQATTGELGLNTISASVLRVYPNPANNVLNIEVKDISTALNVKIVNVLGATVATQNLNAGTNSIDVSNFTAGVYFVQLSNGGAVKFIKE